VVSFTSWPLYPEEWNPGIHLIGWVDLRAGLDMVETRSPCPVTGIKPQSSSLTHIFFYYGTWFLSVKGL